MTMDMDDQLRAGGAEPFNYVEEPSLNDRKRYTAQLQRRAQAHITAELGGSTSGPDLDRQVTMVVQHAHQVSGARRISLFRPVARGRRWHVATMLADGSFYYGLAAPETLRWPKTAFDQKRPFLLDDNGHSPAVGPGAGEYGLSSYISIPVMSGGKPVAVIEAVDVRQTSDLEYYSAQLEESATTLAPGLDAGDAEPDESTSAPTGTHGDLTANSIIDLVLRQPYDVDDAFEITSLEWVVVANATGDRTIKAVADATAMPVSQVISLAATLIDRGLLRTGKENRRRL